jgi:xanthine dehydrogenase YagT iron-sulfur-binding subunit
MAPMSSDHTPEQELDDGWSRRDFPQHTAGSHAADGGATALAELQGTDPVPPRREGPPAVAVTLHVNGRKHDLKLEARVTLLDAMRDYLGLVGTRRGCDHSQCGACTVLVDGRRVYSCLALAVMHDGAHVTTIEGLAQDDKLQPLQAAFIRRHAFQCGYCTSGQICSGIGLLAEGQMQSEGDVREQMSGDICRCGAYPNMVAAIGHVLAARAGRP